MKSTIKFAFLNLRKNPLNSLIHLGGLVIAFTGLLFISIWIYGEYAVDRFHENTDQKFQVLQNFKQSDGVMTFEWTSPKLAASLKEELPEIEHAVPVYQFSNESIVTNDVGISHRANEVFAGADFFEIFKFPEVLRSVNWSQAKPNDVLMTATMAKNLYGSSENALGRTIQLKQRGIDQPFIVKGILEDVPYHSTLQFDLVLPYSVLLTAMPKMDSWTAYEPFTYVQLAQQSNVASTRSAIEDFMSSKIPAEDAPSLIMRPLADQYLYNNYENGQVAGGRIEYIRFFGLIALAVLLIALVNYVNLSTARANTRTKEIGVKKVLGMGRHSMVFQLLTEAVILSALALLLALVVSFVSLSFFNTTLGSHLELPATGWFYAILFAIAVFSGILAGIYPAFFLSGMKTLGLMKGKVHRSRFSGYLRKGLIVFQFSVSACMITAVLIISKQMSLVQNKNLGYDTTQLISIKKDGKLLENDETFLIELERLSGVVNATGVDLDAIQSNGTATKNVIWNGKNPQDEITFKYLDATDNLVDVLGLDIIQGQNISLSASSNYPQILLNETAVAKMGLRNPVGQVLKIWNSEVLIKGVVADFHYSSLYENIEPLFIKPARKTSDILIKIRPQDQMNTIAQIEHLYQELNGGLTANWEFLDQSHQKIYDAEKLVASLTVVFSAVAIFLSCLGLLGLITFTLNQRQKEISLRRVLGANSSRLVVMLSKDFMLLIITALLISIPLTIYFTQDWLDQFAYRADIGMTTYLLAAICILGISGITLLFKVYKSAVKNPAISLRNE